MNGFMVLRKKEKKNVLVVKSTHTHNFATIYSSERWQLSVAVKPELCCEQESKFVLKHVGRFAVHLAKRCAIIVSLDTSWYYFGIAS